MSQPEELLELLVRGPVTPLQAWVELGNYRLADSVYKLRKQGYVIDMELKPFTTARGKEVTFGVYHLVAIP